MRVIFMGTPPFAVVCLQKMLQEKVDVVAVVTAPDRPVGRGQKVRPSAVKEAALAAEIPVMQPEKLNDPGFLKEIEELKPDLMVIVAFRILPEALFSIPTKGAVNLHGSLLPKYRGAAPINWAIINGESETGVTTFFLKQKVDTGNMIAQEKISITPNMTAGELHDIMADTGANLLLHTIQMIATGTVTTEVQSEVEVSKAPKIFPEDCRINFNQPVRKVHNFIRGLSPRPGAYTFLNSKRIHLFGSIVENETTRNNRPGTMHVEKDSDCFYIQCSPGIIRIGEVKPEGKRQMKSAEFLRGYQVADGTMLGL